MTARKTNYSAAAWAAGIAITLILLAGCSGGSTDSANPQDSPPAATGRPASPAGPGTIAPAAGPITGQITALNGSTWTVRTTAGQTFTVTTSPSTVYGSKKDPATAQSFAIGEDVRITGTRNGNTITATRIRTPSKKHTS